MDSASFLNSDDEQKRYLQHNNDVNNLGYRSFVSPIVNAVLNKFNADDTGLDFGAGTGPVVAQMLRENNMNVSLFDPFFHNQVELLNNRYNYIVCCEVIEHFHYPHFEFGLLKSLLHEKGELFIMTNLFDEKNDFKKWHYKDDPTHVFFYHAKSFQFIKKEFGFSQLSISDRLVRLTL